MGKQASSQNSQREEGNLKTQQHILHRQFSKTRKNLIYHTCYYFSLKTLDYCFFFFMFLWCYTLKTIYFLPAGGGIYGVLKYTGRLWEPTLSTDQTTFPPRHQTDLISTLLIVKLRRQISYYMVWKAQNRIIYVYILIYMERASMRAKRKMYKTLWM